MPDETAWGLAPVAVVSPSGDGTGATDSAAINNAMVRLAALGGGTVLLAPSTNAAPFWINSLILQTGVTLRGPGGNQSCVLRAPLGHDTTPMVSLSGGAGTGTQIGWAIYDLAINGNNGSYFNLSGGQQANAFQLISIDAQANTGQFFGPLGTDMVTRIENVLCVNGSADNISATGRCSEVRLRDVYSVGAKLSNFYCGNQDVFYDTCTSGHAGGAGWFITSKSAQLVNCKSWWSGQVSTGYGFRIETGSDNSLLTGCFAQDCTGYGFYLDTTCQNVTITGASSAGHTQAHVYLANGATGNKVDVEIGNASNNSGHVQYYLDGVAGSSANVVEMRGDMTKFFNAVFNPVTAPNNRLTFGIEDGGSQTVAFAAAITPNPYLGSSVICALTGNITIANPSQGHAGTRLRFFLSQDVTGGRTVTWGAAYKTTAAIPTAASTTTVIEFESDGTTYHEVSRATA